MSDAYVGEIRRFGGTFAPDGWLLCDGRVLSADEYADLFAVIGTRFGGDHELFALPNLNDTTKSTSDVAYIIATTGRLPVEPQLRVEPMKTVITLLVACTLFACVDDPTGPQLPVGSPQALVLTTSAPVFAISTGRDFSCVIKTDQSVTCFGYNYHGQTSPPAGLGSVLKIAAGSYHACAIKLDNTVACWGDNFQGQLNVPAAVTSASQIAAGNDHSCAIKSDNTLVCWGNNSWDQSTVPAGTGTVKQVTLGDIHTCAIKSDDTLICWGRNNYGEVVVPGGLGTVKQASTYFHHTCAIKSDDTVTCFGLGSFGATTPPTDVGTVKKVAVGGQHACVIKADDTVACWGYNGQGQTNVPAGLGAVTAISTGFTHTCAIKTDDTPVCWGENDFGETSVPVLTPTTSTSITAGGAHSCTIRNGSSIVCWGRNNFGQSTPPQISGPRQVAGGGFHTCAIKTDYTVACWGNNSVGQLTLPVGLGAVKSLVAAQVHSCAIKNDDTLACWGSSTSGAVSVPPGLGTVTQVALGQDFTCALKSNQTVECWGANFHGQLSIPGDLGTVQYLAAGPLHACAVKTNGSVVCWGYNNVGQATVPNDLGTVTRIVAGLEHACVLESDGAVRCWGSNTLGQTTIPASMGGIAEIAGGREHTCAVETDGLTTVCWGSNQYGQSTAPGQLKRYLPTATFTAPASVESGAGFTIQLTDAQVVMPTGTLSAAEAGIQYAFDCGSGYGSFSSNSSANCTAGPVGSQTVKGKVQDQDGDAREYTASVGVSAAPTPPAAPANLALAFASGPNRIILAWNDASVDETSFQVQRRSRPEGGDWSDYSHVAYAAEDATGYEDTNVTQSTTYQYRVRARNAIGNSAFAISPHLLAGTPPEAPSSVTATAVGLGMIDVTWPDASSIETRYEIQRSRSKTTGWTAYTALAPLPANSNGFSDSGLGAAEYRYQVRACNLVGCSAWITSNIQLANTAPLAPTNVTASALSSTSVQITWTDASNNEKRFTVQRRMHNGTSFGAWQTLGNTAINATGYADNTAAADTRYQYRVRSSNTLGPSEYVVSNGVTTPN